MSLRNSNSVRDYVDGLILSLWNGSSTSHSKSANLAFLRRSVGIEPGVDPSASSVEFSSAPLWIFGDSDEPSAAEWGVHIAMSLWAQHQAAKSSLMYVSSAGDFDTTLGHSAHLLAMKSGVGESDSGMSRLMVSILRSDSVVELEQNLRRLVLQLRSNGICLDYALLAQQIYNFCDIDERDAVLRQWSRDYFSFSNKADGLASVGE